MKYLRSYVQDTALSVALLVSAWIEILVQLIAQQDLKVALLVSAWIEMIFPLLEKVKSGQSHSL